MNKPYRLALCRLFAGRLLVLFKGNGRKRAQEWQQRRLRAERVWARVDAKPTLKAGAVQNVVVRLHE